ncbi:MAG: hypothetical protein ACD_13C00144G0061 [uncultured bacterium]|nr:MAG: hypothetical protein ACD_13C00144G0061 [uncultured bacterium]KKR52762.1 MAG: hypothetical protein UT88_C0022G0008 [Candidatus Woesebacteria bacterium GW2011_GWD2_40_19]HAU65355.1 hypothetical protein [Candidatus Woesebacteria bacterium]HCC09109.1 hypothetical protein [Candidatus Woesebacteria bacterium]
MKFVSKILLIILSVPILVLCVLSINVRLQFLSSDFWIGTFEKADVYTQISTSLSSRLFDKVVAGGGKGSDVAVLSSLISPNILKIFFEENIKSILLYANGKSSEIVVFTPFSTDSILRGVKAEDLGNFSEKMTLDDFLKKFNITGINEKDIQIVSKFGIWSWLFVIGSLSLLALVLVLTYLLTGTGKRLTTMGIELTLSGICVLVVNFLADFIVKSFTENFAGSANVGTSLIAITAPPIIQNITQIWIWFGISSLILGVLLFFIKKPGNSIRRKG